MNDFPAPSEKELPRPPGLRHAIGVGIVVVGMAMGTGELIMWPHLVTRYGLVILWFALVGITIQYFINQEVARHTLATGESFFTSSARVLRYSPIFWLGAAVLLYIWPAWATALGTILAKLFGFGGYLFWAWASLLLVLIITFSGKVAYRVLERSLKITVPVFFVLLVIISFKNLNSEIISDAVRGLFNFGYVPANVDWSVLLGAIVFAGAGGMLNLCVSLWYRDKQLGMSHYIGRIANPISGLPEAVSVTGHYFTDSQENLSRWRGWMNYVRIDQGLIFWFLGLLTLFLLSVNAYAVLSPLGIVPAGLDLVSAQARIFSDSWGSIGEKLYLVMAYLMLFSVMWTVLDALTRIVSDIIHTNSRAGKLVAIFKSAERFSIHHLYYGLMVVFVFLSAILVPFQQPFVFLVITSVLGGLVTALYIPLLLYLNNRKLHKSLRPSWGTNLVLVLSAIFYWYFVYNVISSLF
ncbi:MAG: Nramp family divalent metal transporter [Candidatus Paceibacterota bacterium]|jgi:hypothetical protein